MMSKGPRASPLLGLKPTQCGAGVTSQVCADSPAPRVWVQMFLFIFLTAGILPHPNKIKQKITLYIGEDRQGSMSTRNNRLEKHGTVNACMTSFTERAQG